MVSAEAKRPRVYIKQAFKTIYMRLAIFFVGGALAAGIVVAYNVCYQLSYPTNGETLNCGRMPTDCI